MFVINASEPGMPGLLGGRRLPGDQFARQLPRGAIEVAEIPIRVHRPPYLSDIPSVVKGRRGLEPCSATVLFRQTARYARLARDLVTASGRRVSPGLVAYMNMANNMSAEAIRTFLSFCECRLTD